MDRFLVEDAVLCKLYKGKGGNFGLTYHPEEREVRVTNGKNKVQFVCDLLYEKFGATLANSKRGEGIDWWAWIKGIVLIEREPQMRIERVAGFTRGAISGIYAPPRERRPKFLVKGIGKNEIWLRWDAAKLEVVSRSKIRLLGMCHKMLSRKFKAAPIVCFGERLTGSNVDEFKWWWGLLMIRGNGEDGVEVTSVRHWLKEV